MMYYGSFLANTFIKNKSKQDIFKTSWLTILKQKKENIKTIRSCWIDWDSNHEASIFGEDFSIRLKNKFAELIKKWYIQQEFDIVYRSTQTQTILPQDEVIFQKKPGKKYVIKYFVSTKNHSLEIATTSPETMFWDAAIAAVSYTHLDVYKRQRLWYKRCSTSDLIYNFILRICSPNN